MSGFAARAEGVGKRFFVPRTQRTVVRAARSWLRGEGLWRELWALRDLSFTLRRGAKLALVGRNGSGKTTLLRLLSGIHLPTCGTIATHAQSQPLFSCAVGFAKELTVAENVILFGTVHGMSRRTLQPRLAEILERAGLEDFAFAPMKDLSTGQVQRLALTVFAQSEADFLVLDEVVGNVDHGFLREADRFFRELASSSRTVIMTSHDAAFLAAYCEQAMWIEGGRVRMHGPFDGVMREYERSFDDPPLATAARSAIA